MNLGQSGLKPGMVVYHFRTKRTATVCEFSPTGSRVPVHATTGHGESCKFNSILNWDLNQIYILPQSKYELYPGMRIKKLSGKRNVGIIIKDEDGNIPPYCSCDLVGIKRPINSGKYKGRMARDFWRIGDFIIWPKFEFESDCRRKLH